MIVDNRAQAVPRRLQHRLDDYEYEFWRSWAAARQRPCEIGHTLSKLQQEIEQLRAHLNEAEGEQ